MANLSTLPTELLIQICRCFALKPWQYPCSVGCAKQIWSLNSRRQTLRHLCLVNKIFCEIAQPLLLQEFSKFAYGDDLHELLDTVVLYPHLRPHVTDLGIDNFLFERNLDERYVKYPLYATVEDFNVKFGNRWMTRLQSPYADKRADAILALYLALLPGLKRVTITWTHTSDAILEKVVSEQLIPSWSTLEELHISRPRPMPDLEVAEQEIDLGVVFQMLLMPGLKRVELNSICSREEVLNLPSNSIRCKELHLRNNYFTPQVLRILMDACNSLEMIEFRETLPWDVQFHTTPPQGLIDILAAHGATLKWLALDFRSFNNCVLSMGALGCARAVAWRMKFPALSFDSFSALEYLSLDVDSLDYGSRGVIRLPPTLTTLAITQTTWHHVPILTDLLERLYAPSVLELRLWVPPWHITDLQLQPIKEQCDQQGIRFRKCNLSLLGDWF